jgi:hypothetical protein
MDSSTERPTVVLLGTLDTKEWSTRSFASAWRTMA